MQTETVINISKNDEVVISEGSKVRIENGITGSGYDTIVTCVDEKYYLVDLDSGLDLPVVGCELEFGRAIGAFVITTVYKKCEINLEE